MNFPFEDEPNTATIVCCHILEEENPILYVSHDEEDGMWQFLCGEEHDMEDARIVSLKLAFELDPAVGELCDMPCGYYATRKSEKHEWIIRKNE